MARDHVHVTVKDGLSGRGADVDTDVETVWPMAHGKHFTDAIDGGPERRFLFVGAVEVVGDVASRDDQRVARRSRIRVEESDDERRVDEEGAFDRAERANFHRGELITSRAAAATRLLRVPTSGAFHASHPNSFFGLKLLEIVECALFAESALGRDVCCRQSVFRHL